MNLKRGDSFDPPQVIMQTSNPSYENFICVSKTSGQFNFPTMEVVIGRGRPLIGKVRPLIGRCRPDALGQTTNWD